MSNRRHLRGVLLNLQDRLNDNDRERLHFYLRDDVPRPIGDDTTLAGNLRLFERLFDQDQLNDENISLLIDALTRIRCLDAANTLRNYQRHMLSNGLTGSTLSLTSIMPPTNRSQVSPLLLRVLDDNNDADDDGVIMTDINYESNNNNNMIDSNNININRTNINSHDQLRSSRNHRLNLSLKTSKILILILVGISCILGTSLVVITTTRIYELTKVRSLEIITYIQTIEDLNGTLAKINQTNEQLKTRLEKLEEEKTTHLIKPGNKFGGNGGDRFDDSQSLDLTSSYYLSGIILSEDVNNVDGYQFIYKSVCENRSQIISNIHGNNGKEIKSKKEFSLDIDERINRVEVKVNMVTFFINGNPLDTYVTKLIRGVRFFTTKSRRFPDQNSLNGHVESESPPGYTLGYVTGRSGLAIDQIQFYWYRV